MNVVNKLQTNKVTIEEVMESLDKFNPIVLYETISYIVRNNICDEMIIDKLIQLSEKLDDEYKMLGYYKLGHVAMAALWKLGYDEKIVFKKGIDEFEKKMTLNFLHSTW